MPDGLAGADRDEWRRWHVPARVRQTVFARDDWTCVDCRHKFPESLLQVDHDQTLAEHDGRTDPNDPTNLTTRCAGPGSNRCHDRKTAAENAARNRGKRKPMSAAPTVPDRPGLAGAVKGTAAGMMLAGGAALVCLAVYPPAVRWLVLAGLAWLVARPTAHVGALRRWRDTCEDQRLFEQLCKVTKDAAATRGDRMKVVDRSGHTPTSIIVRPGGAYPDSPEGLHDLCRAFARAVDVPPAAVNSLARRGRIVLTIDPDGGQAEQGGTPAADVPLTDRQDAVLGRFEQALRPIVDDEAQVAVTGWAEDGSPSALTLTYPPRAASRARDARADLPITMRDLHTPAGEWMVRWESTRDRFVIADLPDPLAPLVPMPDPEPNVDCTAGPVLGILEDGRPWRQPLLGGHVLIAGASGSGKGSPLWGVVRGISPLIADGRARLWCVDPKGGMEFGAARGYAHRFAVDEDEVIELLEEAVEQMRANAGRLATAAVRKIEEPTVDRPLNIVLVDEIASITAYMSDSKLRAQATGLLSKLLSQGRAGGYVVIGALQDPRAEVLKMRNLFTFSIALRLNEPQQVDMVLGKGVRSRGAVCDLIPKSLPGVGFVVADGMADPLRFRAAFVGDDEVERLAAELGRPSEPKRPPEHGSPVVPVVAELLPSDLAPRR